jgi:hypothetical protein
MCFLWFLPHFATNKRHNPAHLFGVAAEMRPFLKFLSELGSREDGFATLACVR